MGGRLGQNRHQMQLPRHQTQAEPVQPPSHLCSHAQHQAQLLRNAISTNLSRQRLRMKMKRDIKRQLVAEASAVPKSDAQVPSGTAADGSNVDLVKDVEMTEVDGEDDTSEGRHSGHHSRDDEVEFFAVEAIKGCKLNPRGMVLLRVKWEDYEDPSDLTWEPERVLRKDVPHILDAYFDELGGRDKVLQDLWQKRAEGRANPRRKGTARVKGRGISKSRV
ncbi:hypothetical protein DL95DRAFT_399613 [Leptodontidium sp. 2 PMI_412]|nr:hypothetical protein DL95DRAFT_399613 [Leptodontidium sp. 2 PMI_412]